MGFSCGLMAAHLANAQSQWTTTDAFQLAQGFSSLGLGMGINEFGNILAVGNGIADSSGTTVAITRQSPDFGQTWPTELSGAFNYLGASSCTFKAVANAGQTLYAAAADNANQVPGGQQNWLIVQSTDGGDTWMVSDSFAQGACNAIASDGSGNVFAAGNFTLNGNICPIIRKLVAGGTGWSTVYQNSVPGVGGLGIAFHPIAGVFVVGALGNGTQNSWTVLKSQDGGSTWTVADRYPSPYLAGSYGRGIAVDPQGNIYATGGSENYWITRRSTDRGTTWTTIDKFQYSTKKSTKPTGQGSSLSFDYHGNVYVAGYSGGGTEGFYWIVRKLPAGASSWQNSDVFQLLSGDTSEPSYNQSSILSANGGHVLLVTGHASDSVSDHWITRRLVVP